MSSVNRMNEELWPACYKTCAPQGVQVS